MAATVDAVTHIPSTNGGVTDTIAANHTCGAGTTTLRVFTGWGNSGGPFSDSIDVTYNGVALTREVAAHAGSWSNVEVHKMDNPPIGSSFSVSINHNGALNPSMMVGTAVSVKDSLTGSMATGSGNALASPSSITIASSASGDLCLGALFTDGSTGNLSESGTLVDEEEDIAGDSDYGVQRVTASGASEALTWTLGSSDNWAAAGVAIKGADVAVYVPPMPTRPRSKTAGSATQRFFFRRPIHSLFGGVVLDPPGKVIGPVVLPNNRVGPMALRRRTKRTPLLLSSNVAAVSYILTADPGSVVITGTAAQLEHATIVVAASGTYTISGTAATFKLNMPAAAGVYTITGTVASLLKKSVLVAASGSVLVTGTAAGLLKKSVLTADPGSVVINGTAASLRKGVTLLATAGSVLITGTAATLLKKSVLVAASGTVAITGTAAALKKASRVTADPGSVLINGTAATLRLGKAIVAAAGAYIINGTAATLRAAHVLAATSGVFTINGTPATFRIAHRLTATPGSVAITGTVAILIKRTGQFILASPGSFIISGLSAALVPHFIVPVQQARSDPSYTRAGERAHARHSVPVQARPSAGVQTRSNTQPPRRRN